MDKIAIYCRVSTAKQADNFSIQTQIERGMAFAIANQWDFSIYKEAESGTSVEDRSQFDAMFQDIKAGIITKVWVIHLNRLHRNSDDSSITAKYFRKHKVELYVNGSLQKFETASDRLVYNTQSAVSEYQRDSIVETSIDGKSKMQNQGLLPYPNVYGYDFVYKSNGDKEWFINEDEAAIIRRIYQEFIDLVPMHKLAGRLNEEGYRTKKGKLWDRSQIHQITTRPLYIGKAWNTDGELIESKIYKPIISEEVYNKAQYIRATVSKKRSASTERVAAYELTGLIRCKKCNAQYFYGCNQKTNKAGEFKKWERYYHSIRLQKYRDCEKEVRIINKKWIENEIANIIRFEFFSREDQIEEWMQIYKRRLGLEVSQIEEAIELAKAQLEEVNTKRGRIVSAIADGVLSGEDARVQLQAFKEQKEGLEKLIATKQKDLSLTTTGDEGRMIENLTELFLDFEKLPPTKRRILYQSIFSSMVLDGQKLTLTLTTGEERKILVPIPKHGGKR